MFNEQDLAARPHLIDAHTFITYEKQIRNLQLQEARLARRREKEIAELRRLQAEGVQSKAGTGEHSAPFAESDACPRFAAPRNGFVFSTPEIKHATLRQNRNHEPAPLAIAPDACLTAPRSA